MFVLSVLVELFFQQVITGDDLCSRSIRDINCVPCSEICPGIQTPCNTIYYYCPRQCGRPIPASRCPDVCDNNCLDGRCKYTDGLLGLRCIGCKSEFTGQMCLEHCPINCKECYQYDSTCITCKANYRRPPDCREIVSTKAISNTITPTTASFDNCSVNCRICHINSRDCDKCSHGHYGRICEKVCTHCNISRCAMDRNCLQCISNLSRSECVTAGTEYKTTMTSLVNCTDPNCHQVPGRNASIWLKTLICGILAAVLLTFGSIFIWRKINSRYRLKCVDVGNPERHANSDQNFSGGMTTNPVYMNT